MRAFGMGVWRWNRVILLALEIAQVCENGIRYEQQDR